MISISISKDERRSHTDLELLAESLIESVPNPKKQGQCPSIWMPSRTGLAHDYYKIYGTNSIDQLVEVHYVKELSLTDYYLKSSLAKKQYGIGKTEHYFELFKDAVTRPKPSAEEVEAIKQVFENIYEERMVLKKSPIYRIKDLQDCETQNIRFVIDKITLHNNGPIIYTIEGFNNNPFEMNFKNIEKKQEKTLYFGYDKKTSFLRNKHFEPYLPLLKKGPIRLTSDAMEDAIRTALESAVNQNQEEIISGTIDSLGLLFFNKSNVKDLFFYFNRWLKQKV